jgi:hypothetical protein
MPGTDDPQAYGDFLKQTGFGTASNFAPVDDSQQEGHGGNAEFANMPSHPSQLVANPMQAQQRARPLQKQYDLSQYQRQASNPPNSLQHVPPANTLLPGQLPTHKGLQQREYQKPFPESNVLGRAGIPDMPRTREQSWDAVGIGPNKPKSAYVKPASTFVEKMTAGAASDKERNLMLAAGIFGGVTFVAGVGWTMSRDKSTGIGKGLGPVAGVSFLITMVMVILYTQESKSAASTASAAENQTGRKTLMKYNLGDKQVRPYQRDERDNKVFGQSPDPMDSYADRMARQNTNTGHMEGPRKMLGYNRSPSAPNIPPGLERLPSSQLMRDPRMQNMDEGTYNEYMARLDGEAPNQFHQSHPYMPMSAQWDNRTQIDDGSTVHGIGTAPGQTMRKSKYKDPRMDQAGAKTMHLKDPPPGSMQPLNKTHPWMEQDESGSEMPRMMSTSNERQSGVDMQSFVQERMQNTPAVELQGGQKPLPQFLQPEETMSDRKRSINRAELPQPSHPEVLPGRQNVAPPPRQLSDRQALNMQNPMPEQNQATVHSDAPDMMDYNDAHVAPVSTLADAFTEKRTPSEEEIQKEVLDVRR